jgi:hypothetical protein
MPFNYNAEQVGYAIEAGQEGIESAVAELVDALFDHSAIHVHRAWSASEERKLIIKNATRVALLSVLTSDWTTLDPETAWLHVTREQAKAAA